MHIEHLAILLGLVVVANLLLLAALVLPGLASRRADPLAAGGPAGTATANGALGAAPATTATLGAALEGALVQPMLYERVVRVVGFLFIAAGLIVVSLLDGQAQPLTYGLLALGAFLIVLGQDIVPLSLLGRWRYAIEAVVVIVFVSLLVVLTGGHQSPFYFGYLLLLAGASLWAAGSVPFLLAVLASGAYLVAISLSPAAAQLESPALGVIAFNLIAIALVSYVSAVMGREQRRVREAALRVSRLDALTGLHNRAHVEAALEREILRSARTGRPFSLLMIDLDDLKSVNDRYGHESGDRLLRAAADAIRGGTRGTDVAARYGGDEYVVLLTDTDMAGALRVGEKLRFDISRMSLRHNGDMLRSTASLGLVSYPEDGRTSTDLMRRVDMAMYEAKRRGRNQLVRFAREDELTGQPAAESRPGTARPAEPPPRATTIPIEPPEPGGAGRGPAPWETRRD